MAIPTTCETPRTCRPTRSTSGASPPAVERPPRRSMPRAPRCSAAARPTTPPSRCAHDRATSPTGSDTAWTIGRSSRSTATYREMENTPDGDDAYHGRTGPFPIRHQKYDDLTPSLRGFIDAAVAEGSPWSRISTGRIRAGRRIPGQRRRRRASEHGIVYLTEEVRNRPNLKISGDVLVDRVLFDELVRSASSRQAALRFLRAR